MNSESINVTFKVVKVYCLKVDHQSIVWGYSDLKKKPGLYSLRSALVRRCVVKNYVSIKEMMADGGFGFQA